MGETAITVKLFSTNEQNLVPWLTRHPKFVHPLLWQNVGKSKLQNKTYGKIQPKQDLQLLQWKESDTTAGVKLATENSDRVA
jgi:hypothetical protein